MALKDSFQTHIVGSLLEIKKWGIFEWGCVMVRLFILGIYIIAESVISAIIWCLKFSLENPITGVVVRLNQVLWGCVPVVGRYGIKILPRFIYEIKLKWIPRLNKLSQLVQLCFQVHLVEMTLKDKKNVQIFLTAESDSLELYDDEGQLVTTLLLANHRSINDYMLINYLIQNCSKYPADERKMRNIVRKFWQDDVLLIPRLNFITWGKIVNFPELSLLKNILMLDENAFVVPTKIKDHLTDTGNQVLAIFPEVNIMTTELSIIQRKLCQDYPFMAKFYNVLYPRFKSFISTIRCFAHIKHFKLNDNGQILTNIRIIFNNGVNKFISKAAQHSQCTVDKQKAQASMIVGVPPMNDYEDIPEIEDDNGNEPPIPVKINQHFYDLTIVYYKPKYTKSGHDHINGQLGVHEGYQLEQINPSVFEMLQPDRDLSRYDEKYKRSRPPIIIMIHIKKHQLAPLLPAKGRSLEKWLESKWYEKDKMIDSIEDGIRVR
ncbi:hypothetical protein HG537_0C01410 [Torulaspora globosa]|uniref:Uncharacterized protein n=1 Tax=Torulaspora globosa TaxID=48254 RepID=A0A7H9HNZ1_9SACH|nr:hypothetical protein HG537_0C01410 [Torulaspora sp. CBS 2947]